jgi:hypothetical protein
MGLRLCLVCSLTAFALNAAEVTLGGRVTDENDAPVENVRVIIHPAPLTPPRTGLWETRTIASGSFSVTLPEPGNYRIDAEREGYYQLKDRPVHVESTTEVTLVINSVREVFQSVDVNEQPSPVDISQTQNQIRLTGTEVNNIPYPNSHSLRNSVKLMPDVIEDASGGFHVNGAQENQVQYRLNGFNITNPVSGQYQTILAVEGIRSLDLSTGRLSPDLGKGSAGTLAINTASGTDAFHYTATNFVPGFKTQEGLHLSNWYPRVGISGPMVRGRAWFSDTFDSEYTNAIITGLPRGQDSRNGWAGSELLHTQVNITPSNILHTDFLVNIDNQGRVGLGALSPVSTTTSLHTREYMASIKDQIFPGAGMMIEAGYAHNHFSDSQTPQGPGLYLISPEGTSGNYFVSSHDTASRDQSFIQVALPQAHWFGSHQLQAGSDVDVLNYDATFHRTGYEVVSLTGAPLSETLYEGPGLVHVRNLEVSGWVLDTWHMSKRLQVDLGVREDWDRRVDNALIEPRIAFSWSPSASGKTRISGGYSLTADAVTLGMLGRPLDQTALTTTFGADGAPAGPPQPASFTLGNSLLKLPRATNWTASVDHTFTAKLYATAKYTRRRTSDGFAFVNTLAPDVPPSALPLPNTALAGLYELTNLRHDNFDSVQLSLHQNLSGQYEWMVSWTHSRAVSNTVIDPNSPQPLQLLQTFVPVPWNAPNRVLAETYLPLPWHEWSVAALADLRSGFPFSIRDQSGVIVGGVDGQRYPVNFDLNLAIERMVTLHGYRFALRGGVNNLTARANPTAVYNTTGTAEFLHFAGDEGRHFTVRIRFFGRAGSR